MEARECPVCRRMMISPLNFKLLFQAGEWKEVIGHCVCGAVYPLQSSKKGDPAKRRQNDGSAKTAQANRRN